MAAALCFLIILIILFGWSFHYCILFQFNILTAPRLEKFMLDKEAVSEMFCIFWLILSCIAICVCVQVLYSEKDLVSPTRVQLVTGEGRVSLLLGVLEKYTVYTLQVLAYTRMGDGPPCSPVLLRTREDGGFCLCAVCSPLHTAAGKQPDL